MQAPPEVHIEDLGPLQDLGAGNHEFSAAGAVYGFWQGSEGTLEDFVPGRGQDLGIPD